MDNKSNNNSICSHDGPCWMSSLKGLRQGIYYGGKVRFVHALVMTILFKKGTIKEKIKSILQLTYEHAKNLGLYVFLYKSGVCLLNKSANKQRKIHSLISGAIFGYIMFGKESPVTMQINLYLLSRIIHGGLSNLQEENIVPKVGLDRQKNGQTMKSFFPILASLVWAIVMYLFEDDVQSRLNKDKKPTMQNSLYSSMDFLYKESDKKYSHWSELVPFKIPDYFIKNVGKHNNNMSFNQEGQDN